jgi:hypothetical protein
MAARKEQWWNDADRVTPKILEKTLFLCNFNYHKHHMVWPGIESRLFVRTLANNRLGHD